MAKRSQNQLSLFDAAEPEVVSSSDHRQEILEQIKRDVSALKHEDSIQTTERSEFWIEFHRARIFSFQQYYRDQYGEPQTTA